MQTKVSVVRVVRRLLAVPEVGVLIPLLAFTTLFAIRNPALLGGGNIASMLRGMSFVGVIAVGQTLLMICGELDLSVGSVAGLCAIVAAHLMKNAGWSVEASVLAGLACGATAGLVNGFFAVRVGLPAFIATLGMLYIARGLNYLLCKGYPIYPLPPAVKQFGSAEPLGVSWSFWVMLALIVAADIMLRRTVTGREMLATGGNREAAQISGINTLRTKWMCYVFTGMLAATGGMLLMSQISVGQAEIGTGWELDVIAGVVIGGVSLFGGVGTVAGTFLGLLIMQVVRSGLVMAGVNTHWQTVAVGAIMILAVSIDLFRRSRARAVSMVRAEPS